MAETISPLRYPGGKSKLAPLVRYIVENKTTNKINTYIEPFAGGAGVALDLLINDSKYLLLVFGGISVTEFFFALILHNSSPFRVCI